MGSRLSGCMRQGVSGFEAFSFKYFGLRGSAIPSPTITNFYVLSELTTNQCPNGPNV